MKCPKCDNDTRFTVRAWSRTEEIWHVRAYAEGGFEPDETRVHHEQRFGVHPLTDVGCEKCEYRGQQHEFNFDLPTEFPDQETQEWRTIAHNLITWAKAKGVYDTNAWADLVWKMKCGLVVALMLLAGCQRGEPQPNAWGRGTTNRLTCLEGYVLSCSFTIPCECILATDKESRLPPVTESCK